MAEILWVGFGGFIGAILRFTISAKVQSLQTSIFPLGTLVVNTLGCFAIGFLMALLDRGWLPSEARLFLGAGLLGALTTFSTFSWESLDLIRAGSPTLALVNILSSLVLGLAGAAAGLFFGRIL